MEQEHTPSDETEVVSSTYARIFGLEQPTEGAVRLVKTLTVLLPSFATSFQISTSFYLLFIAETLGGGDYIAGLTLVGFLVVFQLAVQTALDYPTGALGDWIGQRYVIASALFCYSVAFWVTSTVTPTTPFPVFLLIYGLFGLGASQESGAFHAWFDNNYRVAMPHDKDRKQYGVFWGRVGMVWQVSSTMVLIPGSYLALVFQRTWVFMLQSFFTFGLAIAVLALVRDLPGARPESDERPSLSEYGSLLKDGVKFLGSSRFVTFIILGEVILWSTGPVWWNILLFPFYAWYLISDVAISSFRTMVFLPQALANERSGIWSRRFEPKKWIPRFRFLQFGGFVFYMLLASITYVFPPASGTAAVIPFIDFPVDTLIPVALIFTTFVIVGVFGGMAQILTQRVMIDVIPNRIRNSMYSLQPTLAMLVAMPVLLFTSWIIPFTGGFPPAMVVLAFITLGGALLVRKAFTYPIAKAEDIAPATQEEIEEVEELEVT
ncbi:MAG: hypothetical protein ACW99U_16050 [Candidatus Thorarchaeota archaeon]